MTLEIWLPIEGHEEAYEVSNLGRVRSLARRVRLVVRGGVETTRGVPPRILRPGPTKHGHLTVAIGRRNSRQVHDLVLRAFVGPPAPGQEALHGDGNPANNALSNLRWGTRSENNFDITAHERRRLSHDQVRYIRKRAAEGFAYGERYQLSLAWGVNPGTIYYVASGKEYSRVV